MGFGSFKRKFKKATGLSLSGSAIGFAVGGPIGGIIGGSIGDDVSAFIKDPTGAKAAAKQQAAALRAAGRIEEAQRLEEQAFRAQVMAETAPFREQGRAELERLRGQEAGSTQFFRQGLERGSQAIAQQRARFGLAESGGTGRQFEELGAGLLGQEELQRQQGLQSAAALSQLGFGTGTQLLGLESASAGRQAQTQANIGALKAQAKLANRQFYTGLGTQLLGSAGGYLLGGGLGGAGGGAATATAAGGFGSRFTLQQPQFNQFQSPYGG